MLVVRHPNTFVAERQYVLRVLLKVILGVPYAVVAEASSGYRFEVPGGAAFELPDAFWQGLAETEDYLLKAPVPVEVSVVENRVNGSGEALVGFFPVDDPQAVLPFDLIATSFYLLTDWQSWAWQEKHPALGDVPDSGHGQPDEQYHPLIVQGLTHRPLVEEYAHWLLQQLQLLGYTQEHTQHSYEAQPTHDIDRLLLTDTSLKLAWVNGHQLLGSTLYHSLLPKGALVLGPGTDPYNSYTRLMQQAEAAGAQAIFFLKAGATHPEYDLRYSLRSEFATRLLREIRRRGHAVGFHPSYLANTDEALWQNELEALNRAAGQAPVAVRGHFLRQAPPFSWRWAEQAGIAWDSTLGYNIRNGFKAGMCRPYPLFDFLARRKMQLWERPLLFMESARLPEHQPTTWPSPAQLKAEVDEMKATVRHYGGQLLFNWHNDHVLTPPYVPYQSVLASLYKH